MKKVNLVIKYILGLAVVLLIRLIPWRVPNIEPVMATTMPFGKRFNYLGGFAFGFLSIIIFDLLTKFGVWTWVTAAMYGLVGLGAAWWFKNRSASALNFAGFSVVATLIYDFITGPIMSSVIFKMSFMQALIGQIPFTLWHLGGNVIFAVVVSPVLYKLVVGNEEFAIQKIWQLVSRPVK
ncbi:MAG: hypothetical protein V1807_01300 [Patescibacteria group bacterium]